MTILAETMRLPLCNHLFVLKTPFVGDQIYLQFDPIYSRIISHNFVILHDYLVIDKMLVGLPRVTRVFAWIGLVLCHVFRQLSAFSLITEKPGHSEFT